MLIYLVLWSQKKGKITLLHSQSFLYILVYSKTKHLKFSEDFNITYYEKELQNNLYRNIFHAAWKEYTRSNTVGKSCIWLFIDESGVCFRLSFICFIAFASHLFIFKFEMLLHEFYVNLQHTHFSTLVHYSW